jgi:hypothetical protein
MGRELSVKGRRIKGRRVKGHKGWGFKVSREQD